MENYWGVNDKVISTLDRELENKSDTELKEDYNKLQSISIKNNFADKYLSFSLFPAILAGITTILIAIIRPEYIQLLLDLTFGEIGIQIDLNKKVVGVLLSVLNFSLTIIGLTNVVNFQINKIIEGKPIRKLQTRHIKVLSKNASRHSRINIYRFINPKSSNPIIREALRNFKLEPVGTNILYPYVLSLHRKELEKRGISTNNNTKDVVFRGQKI